MSSASRPEIPQPIPEPLAVPTGPYKLHPGRVEGCVLLPDRMDLKKDADTIRDRFLNHLHFSLAKDRYTATGRPVLGALAYTVRDYLIKSWIETQRHYYHQDHKRVYYLSMEYLVGRTMLNSLINLEMYEQTNRAMKEVGLDLHELCEIEWDAGLGNGGLGRLAACYLDAMATHKIPAHGYGLRYDYGIFYQQIVDGYQIEKPDNWTRFGNPWEFNRHDHLYPVFFNGRVQTHVDEHGQVRYEWVDTDEVLALATDTPTPGYANGCVNTMRLWTARPSRGFNFEYFNHGDYMQAIAEKATSENITSVLYPNDSSSQGRELRLKQEYFLVSSSLQDIMRRFLKTHHNFGELPDKVAIQLNDTHPSLAIPEMMRILMDQHELGWDEAWGITTKVMAYTNHTILPEALERWGVDMLGKLLPRHLQIIYEINRRFLEEVATRWPNDELRLRRMSLIEEGDYRCVNMAHLSIVGSHKINGVSQLHGNILKEETFKDFYEMWPDKFMAITNGVTPRLWLKACNPHLANLITHNIGSKWPTHLNELKKLLPLSKKPNFRDEWHKVKRAAKEQLSTHIVQDFHLRPLDPDSLFDVQIKRIHEYKRQTLNLLHIVHRYRQILDGEKSAPRIPRTILMAGKAAPGYLMAKLIIKLATSIGDTIAAHPEASKWLNVQFLPNYSVSLAQSVCPASDLSEQISTAGTEASGTGCMKLCLNGAVTIGTFDGANIEILEEVGAENFFLFGLTTPEVNQLRAQGYHPRQFIDQQPALAAALDLIRSGHFSPHDPHLFDPLLDRLVNDDPFLVCADFAAYLEAQERVEKAYQNRDEWIKKSIANTASMGKFSSDRAIEEYAKNIWNVSIDGH